MKLLKYLFITLLPLMLTINTAHANHPKQPVKVKKQDKNLTAFNNAFGIKLINRQITQNPEGKPVAIFKYELENKSKQTIKTAHWVSALTFDNKIIFTQDFPITFNEGLKPKQKTEISATIPFENFTDEARQAIGNLQNPIGMLNAAKSLLFTNGSKIVMK